MPRRKADKVITHRIELGSKEREYLDELVPTAELWMRLGMGMDVFQPVADLLYSVFSHPAGLAAVGLFLQEVLEYIQSKDPIYANLSDMLPFVKSDSVDQVYSEFEKTRESLSKAGIVPPLGPTPRQWGVYKFMTLLERVALKLEAVPGAGPGDLS